MKVLLCHNIYQQPGGEDGVFNDERWLLESRGHEVLCYTLHNDAIDSMPRLRVARKTFYNQESYAAVAALIEQHRPAVVHCHNIFPLISPSVYQAARERGVAVVQTLHNYRLLCPKAVLMRDGQVCEDCLLRRFALPAVVHGCYRGSRLGSAVVAGMTAWHRHCGTWHDQVDRYIALTEFAREKFIAGGLPAEKLAVKPNFVHPDPGQGVGQGNFAVFVGRLAVEKGIDCLLEAWSQHEPPLPLKIIGDGPLADRVQAAAAEVPQIEWLGRLPPARVCEIVGDARMLIMPSTWYETFGRTITEAFSKGTPVVASRLGAMQELVKDGRTGLLFSPGDAADLAAKVRRLAADNKLHEAMRNAARQQFEQHYTAERNYSQLIAIYEQALQAAGKPCEADPQPTS